MDVAQRDILDFERFGSLVFAFKCQCYVFLTTPKMNFCELSVSRTPTSFTAVFNMKSQLWTEFMSFEGSPNFPNFVAYCSTNNEDVLKLNVGEKLSEDEKNCRNIGISSLSERKVGNFDNTKVDCF